MKLHGTLTQRLFANISSVCCMVGPRYTLQICTNIKLMKGKALRKHSLHKKQHHWRPLAHEQNSIFKCKQHTSLRTRKIWLHNDVVRGDFLQPPLRHLTPAVVSNIKLMKGKAPRKQYTSRVTCWTQTIIFWFKTTWERVVH